jgi:hypothetical protein
VKGERRLFLSYVEFYCMGTIGCVPETVAWLAIIGVFVNTSWRKMVLLLLAFKRDNAIEVLQTAYAL